MGKSTSAKKSPSIEECQRRVVAATRKYISGKLSADAYDKESGPCRVDYRAAALAVGKSRAPRDG